MLMSAPTTDTNGATEQPEVTLIVGEPPIALSEAPIMREAPIIDSGVKKEEDECAGDDDLRMLRCDILELDKIAGAIRDDVTSIESNAAYIATVRDNAEQLLAAIEAAKTTPKEVLRKIRLSWDRLRQVPVIATPQTPEPDGQLRRAQLDLVSSIAREIVYTIGYKTIPCRLNQWLRKAPAGYYVPFNTVFVDEVPNEEDRAKILQFIAFQPTMVENGLVDAANGLVYRYDAKPTRRWLSLLIVALAFIGLSVIVAGWGLPGRWVDKWPFEPSDWFDLLLIWLAVVAGVIVHLVVGAAKRIREQQALPPVFATNEVVKRVNAREGLILIKLATALIAFFALLAADYLADIDPLTAFLAGYALDSVVGLFSTSLESQAAAQSDLLKQKLGATSV